MWTAYCAYNAKWTWNNMPQAASGVRCVDSEIFEKEVVFTVNLGATAIDLITYAFNVVRFRNIPRFLEHLTQLCALGVTIFLVGGRKKNEKSAIFI